MYANRGHLPDGTPEDREASRISDNGPLNLGIFPPALFGTPRDKTAVTLFYSVPTWMQPGCANAVLVGGLAFLVGMIQAVDGEQMIT